MAGICTLCNNLLGITIKIDGKEYNGCWCREKKFDTETYLGYYSRDNVIKTVKSLKDIADNCDKWDDRLKPIENK